MRKSKKIREPTQRKFHEGVEHSVLRASVVSAVIGFVGVLLSSLLTALPSILLVPHEHGEPDTDGGYFTTNLFYFVGGIILFGIIIVAIASFIRWKNRDVTSLRRRLSEIYVMALTKSALNPQSHMTSNE